MNLDFTTTKDNEEKGFMVSFTKDALEASETGIRDLQELCTGLSNALCFETFAFYRSYFVDFLKKLEPDKKYTIVIGEDNCLVRWHPQGQE